MLHLVENFRCFSHTKTSRDSMCARRMATQRLKEHYFIISELGGRCPPRVRRRQRPRVRGLDARARRHGRSWRRRRRQESERRRRLQEGELDGIQGYRAGLKSGPHVAKIFQERWSRSSCTVKQQHPCTRLETFQVYGSKNTTRGSLSEKWILQVEWKPHPASWLLTAPIQLEKAGA